jgi:DNA-binding PadR family transcriptional regulator
MVQSTRHIALLQILRKQSCQTRAEFYRNAVDVYDEGAHGETILYMAIRALETKGCVSLVRIGEGKRSRIITIRLTELGLFELERNRMSHEPRPHSTQESKVIVRREKKNLLPCGQAMDVCYSGSKCYLSYKCKAALKV